VLACLLAEYAAARRHMVRVDRHNSTRHGERGATAYYNARDQQYFTITGCAVAQHCYNGDVSFLWEKWKL